MSFSILKFALRNILLHKLRSSLTLLGTVLGVGSVISMLAIGEGSKERALEQIRKLGANNVILRSLEEKQEEDSPPDREVPFNDRTKKGLKLEDFDRLLATIPTIEKAVPLAVVRQDAQHARRRMLQARVLGTTAAYFQIKSLTLERGRFLSDTDQNLAQAVGVIGEGARAHLFGHEDPLGKSLLLGNIAVTIIGVLNSQGSGNASPGAVDSENFNNDIYIPLRTCQQRFKEQFKKRELNEITLSVDEDRWVSQTASMSRAILLLNNKKRDDFEIQVPLELLQQAEHEKRIWNLVLGSIAGVSLLVGGIGIMNIMLATVTERTREIGIRRALGAKRRDITLQFLIETITLSMMGGMIGIAFGILLPKAVSRFSEIETSLSLEPILIAFFISVGIGVVFGVYPARRAALLDPIEALRHE